MGGRGSRPVFTSRLAHDGRRQRITTKHELNTGDVLLTNIDVDRDIRLRQFIITFFCVTEWGEQDMRRLTIPYDVVDDRQFGLDPASLRAIEQQFGDQPNRLGVAVARPLYEYFAQRCEYLREMPWSTPP